MRRNLVLTVFAGVAVRSWVILRIDCWRGLRFAPGGTPSKFLSDNDCPRKAATVVLPDCAAGVVKRAPDVAEVVAQAGDALVPSVITCIDLLPELVEPN